MLKLQYEIERVQREVELEKIRSEISKLRGKCTAQATNVLLLCSTFNNHACLLTIYVCQDR